ncbi:hypothetical protein JXM67_07385 [candidate division WOR-3 bacterium]|nr:hypothetical protein [candidate division WOR-3 bacterium]
MRKTKNLIPILAVLLLAAAVTAIATNYYYDGEAAGTVILGGKTLHPLAYWEGTFSTLDDESGAFSGTWDDPAFNNGAGITGTFTGSVTDNYFTGTWSANQVMPDPIGDMEGYVDPDTAYGHGDDCYLEDPPPAWFDWYSTSSN